MARRRKRNSTSELTGIILRGVFLLALFGYVPLIKWWNSIPGEAKVLLIPSLTFIILGSLGLLLVWGQYRKQQRALAWQKAMSVWQNNSKAGTVSQGQSARFLTDSELEEFAKQIYGKMEYKVKLTRQTGDHGVDVHLTNPNQEVELVQCKQWRKPVGEPAVRDLYAAMMHTGAVRGWLWAPNGFSKPARQWVKGKPIVLADDEEIGRLVESAYQL